MKKFWGLVVGFGCLAMLLGGCGSLVSGVHAGMRTLRTHAKVGVLANPEIEWAASTEPLRRALQTFAAEQVDAIIFLGRLTRTDHPRQRAVFEQVWAEVFRGQTPPTRYLVTDAPRLITVKGIPFGASPRRHYGTWDGDQSPVLAFHGGMRAALTDDICFLSPATRVMCAGSMHGIFIPDLYINPPSVANTAQGLLVTVLSDDIEVKRLDFSQKGAATEVAPPWVLPRTGTPSAAATPLPPRFAPGAVLEVIPGYRAPAGSRLATERIVTCRWPTALSRFGGSRAAYYELVVADAASGQVLLRQRFLSPNFYLSEAQDWARISTVIPYKDFAHAPAGRVTLSVTAYTATDKPGAVLHASPLPTL